MVVNMDNKIIRINGIPYTVETTPTISYEQVLKVCKLPMGSTVVYMTTKRGKDDFKAGILEPKKSIELEDGLDISAMMVIDDMSGVA
jgi:hypothetical protein